MGSIRRHYGQKDIAIYCYKKIIHSGIKKSYGRLQEFSKSTIKELINDAKFELYRIYHGQNTGLSKRYLSMYKKGLLKGTATIYKPLKKFILDN